MSSLASKKKLKVKQKLLVTGGGGFVGCHLIDLLAEECGGFEYDVLPKHVALQLLAVLMLLDGYIGFDCFHGSDGFDTSVRSDDFSPFVVFDGH